MQAAADLSAVVGVTAACDALGLARSTFYRQRPRPRLVAGPPAPARQPPARALAADERAAVLAALHAERFRDRALHGAVKRPRTSASEPGFSNRSPERCLRPSGQVRCHLCANREHVNQAPPRACLVGTAVVDEEAAVRRVEGKSHHRPATTLVVCLGP